MCLEKCTAFEEKLLTRMWKGWDGSKSTTTRAKDVNRQVPSNSLRSTVFILDADVITSKWCFLCDSGSVCCAMRIGYVFVLLWCVPVSSVGIEIRNCV